ncbi:hypothetical protein [Mesorhizobium sp. STM 4661]|uniref:hypothetical protein n=1 Tax=Mesorhizobium sp. STM 4661 TaxID=1297570 RepID=UPI0012FB4CE6|nr:hypothetical protein [Mesorhizobium sp. STM 4661]
MGIKPAKKLRTKIDITMFQPAYMGKAEALMWKRYYERRYLGLFMTMFGCGRHVGYSPSLSIKLGFFAAQAARLFQASRSAEEAHRALPPLERYYDLIAIGAPSTFCSREVALTELGWWQARRENKPPSEYGIRIACVASLVYGVAIDKVALAGIRRAQAMEYRDRHEMEQSDWAVVENKLIESYSILKSSLRADDNENKA